MPRLLSLNRILYFLVICCFCLPFARCSDEPGAAEKVEKFKCDSIRLADSVLNSRRIAVIEQRDSHCDSQKVLIHRPVLTENQPVLGFGKEEPRYKRVLSSLIWPGGNFSGLAFAIGGVEAIVKREEHVLTTLPPLIAYLSALLVFIFSLLDLRRYWKKILVLSITGQIGVLYILICVGKDWMYGIPVTIVIWTGNLILSWRILKPSLPSRKPPLSDSLPSP